MHLGVISERRTGDEILLLTRREVRHAGDIFPRVIKPVLADELQPVILRQATTVRDMDAYDVQTPVVGGTCKTVQSFEDAHTLHLRVMLAIRLAWFASNVPLQSRRIPHLQRLVVRRRNEEHVVG